jgi:hypothetical protein
MKKPVMLLVFGIVLAIGLVVRVSTRDAATTQPRTLAAKKAAPMRISKQFELAAGSVETIAFSVPGVPGTLSGEWKATGKSGNNTLSGYTLTDPSDAVLDSSFKGSSGRFQVKLSSAGKHTFFFENAGHKQPRYVQLDAEFQPD